MWDISILILHRGIRDSKKYSIEPLFQCLPILTKLEHIIFNVEKMMFEPQLVTFNKTL